MPLTASSIIIHDSWSLSFPLSMYCRPPVCIHLICSHLLYSQILFYPSIIAYQQSIAVRCVCIAILKYIRSLSLSRYVDLDYDYVQVPILWLIFLLIHLNSIFYIVWIRLGWAPCMNISKKNPHWENAPSNGTLVQSWTKFHIHFQLSIHTP